MLMLATDCMERRSCDCSCYRGDVKLAVLNALACSGTARMFPLYRNSSLRHFLTFPSQRRYISRSPRRFSRPPPDGDEAESSLPDVSWKFWILTTPWWRLERRGHENGM